MTKETQATASRPYRELIKIGMPIILGQVGVIIVSFIDNMMVGRYATDHFAAASFVNNIFALVYVLGTGFAYGLTPLVTTAWTRGMPHKAGTLLQLSLILNLALALISSVVMGIIYLYLDKLSIPSALIPIARPYFLIQMLSFVFFMLFNAFKQYFDGTEHTSMGMWIILGGNVLNIVLNWVLIYGQYGMPELGLTGAGIATLVARVVMLVIAVAVFVQLRVFKHSVHAFERMHWSPRNVNRLLRLGVPVGLYSGLETASFTIVLLFVGMLGKLPLAVHQILCVVTTIGFFIYYGLGAATSILVSRYRTLGNMPMVRQSADAGLRLCLAAAMLAMLIMTATREWVGYLFNDDEAIVRMTSIALIPVILYQLGDAIQVLYANVLRGMEDVKHLALYSGLTHLLLEPSLAYFFGFGLGLTIVDYQLMAVWSAFPIGLLTLGLLLRHRFMSITR